MVKWVRRNIYKVNDIVGYYYGSLGIPCKRADGITDYKYRIQQLKPGLWIIFEYNLNKCKYTPMEIVGNHPLVGNAFKSLKDAKDYIG